MEIVFWLLIALVFYTYLGYGILLYLILKVKHIFRKKREWNTAYEPEVTLVVPAYNEEDFITAKAKNCLELDYPREKLRIIFITDGSTDNTPEILSEIEGIEVLHSSERAGKAAAENRAMKFVKSPVVVFCDANTHLNKNCIRELTKYYQDPRVGAVAGEKKVRSKDVDNASSAGEGLYWRYESMLKKWDSELYTVVGAAGELISFRTELVEDLEEDTILDDFVQSLRICEKGYRVVYEPRAVAMETASENVDEELKRKIRIAAGGWQAMVRLKSLLNPLRNPLLSFQYISHRVLRWSVSALALPFILVLNLLLAAVKPGYFYQSIFLLQLLFYLLAAIGWMLEHRNIRLKLLFVPFYFLMMNYAVFAGFLRWSQNKQRVTWERVKRAEQ